MYPQPARPPPRPRRAPHRLLVKIPSRRPASASPYTSFSKRNNCQIHTPWRAHECLLNSTRPPGETADVLSSRVANGRESASPIEPGTLTTTMVSYPDSNDGRSQATRRAPSVVSSRTSTTRHHRHRSHRSQAAGSSSYQPQNEFPIFTHTGDVEIVLKNENGRREQRYKLHRLILAQCSGFFEAGTSQEWSKATTEPAGAANAPEVAGSSSGAIIRAQDAVASGGQRKRWRYELDWGSGRDDVPLLVQKVREMILKTPDKPQTTNV